MSTQTKTPKAAAKTVEKATAAPTSAPVEATVEAVTEQVEKQVEKAAAVAAQGYGDFAVLQKEAFDALVRSGEILTKGAEALGKEYLAFAQEAAEANNQAAKALMGAKSVTEFVQLQSDYFRISLDKSVDEGTKLSEMSMKIATEAFEPLQKQMTAAVEAGIKPLSV
ncbi:MAG: phasin family protein [Rhodospirillales bacterium]|nr:MAG: phasin family protein [Rhodospirillales bacterium]